MRISGIEPSSESISETKTCDTNILCVLDIQYNID